MFHTLFYRYPQYADYEHLKKFVGKVSKKSVGPEFQTFIRGIKDKMAIKNRTIEVRHYDNDNIKEMFISIREKYLDHRSGISMAIFQIEKVY